MLATTYLLRRTGTVVRLVTSSTCSVTKPRMPSSALSGRWLSNTAQDITGSEGPAGPGPDEPDEALIAEHVAEIKSLNETIAELKKEALYAQANQENLRKRFDKELADSKKFGIQKFSGDLIAVADVLEMAIKAMPKEDEASPRTQLEKNIFAGLESTNQMLLKTFSRHGLEQFIPAVGDELDTATTEAQFVIPNPDATENTIAVVARTGYILQGRTIRPAGVGVVKN